MMLFCWCLLLPLLCYSVADLLAPVVAVLLRLFRKSTRLLRDISRRRKLTKQSEINRGIISILKKSTAKLIFLQVQPHLKSSLTN